MANVYDTREHLLLALELSAVSRLFHHWAQLDKLNTNRLEQIKKKIGPAREVVAAGILSGAQEACLHELVWGESRTLKRLVELAWKDTHKARNHGHCLQALEERYYEATVMVGDEAFQIRRPFPCFRLEGVTEHIERARRSRTSTALRHSLVAARLGVAPRTVRRHESSRATDRLKATGAQEFLASAFLDNRVFR